MTLDAPLAPRPQLPDRLQWRINLHRLGQRHGFCKELGKKHTALYVKRGKTLIVSFENLDHIYETHSNRLPWAFDLAEKNDWSMLGMMAHGWTWYRDEAVFDFFDHLRDTGFFKQFDHVVFYGASMGAYAAAAFSAAAPGARVILFSPQATLERRKTGWETRYPKALRQDFSGRYSYAPDQVQTAEKVYLFYDPAEALDSMHASLFQSDNVIRLRCRYMGHRIASLWAKMGILKPIIHDAMASTLTPSRFYALLRTRRDSPRYQREMLVRLEKRNRYHWVAYYAQAILDRCGARPTFRAALQKAHKKLGRPAP